MLLLLLLVSESGLVLALLRRRRFPSRLSGRQCYVLDPMLATGGTLAAAIQFLLDRGAMDVTALCLLADA